MKVAVIGGIGSGKSEVMKVIREKGYSCLSADEINASLLKTPSYIEKIKEAFPTAVINGEVDKKALSDIVFSDDSKRELLNSIAHPEIAKKILECKDDPLFVELPLVLESGIVDIFDEFILVMTNSALRLDRLEQRGLTREKAVSIINAQVDLYKLRALANYVIYNDGTLEELKYNSEVVLGTLLRK